jgi:peptidyl-prolyl cis-trans isomerase D
MAVISKIRQRAGLLIGIVGFSLVAFILGDLLTSNRSFLSGNDNNVAVIGGKKIDVRDFEAMVNRLETNYKMNTGSEAIDQNTLESLREQAWNELLNQEIMAVQYEKTGVKVSSEELFEMIQGKNPHPQIKDAFKDPKTGEFTPGKVIEFLKNMDNDQTGKTRAQWVNFEKYMQDERIKEKYNDLIKHGLFATTAEAKLNATNQGSMATARFIDINYNTVVDSTLKIEEKELRDYYNTNKNDFKQEASRKLEYVVFDVVPSAEDRESAYKSIEKVADAFRTSDNDSLFVAVNSDNKTEITYFKKGTLSPSIDSMFFSGVASGTVVGPYEENNTYKLSKLIELKSMSDSIKVSHALVAYAGAERAPGTVTITKEQAKAKADSLFAIIKKDGKRFNDIAKNNSDDAVASAKEGDLDWITRASPMDPKFKDGAFGISKGNFTLVESNFGFHIIKVTDQTASALQARVASIDRRILPGSKTYQAAFAKANEFASKNTTEDAFNKAVQEQGLNKRIAENLKETDKAIPGLESPRALVQWAYRSKKGDVSKSYDFGNKFVVAVLTEVKEKGIAPFEQASELVKGKVAIEKKAAMFIEKMNNAMKTGKNIDELAAALGLQVKNATNVSFASSYVNNLGMEPTFVGTAFSTKTGVLSKPVKGTAAVYVLVVDAVTEPPATTDFSANKQQIEQQLKQRSTYEVFNALKEKANITDNRGKFY